MKMNKEVKKNEETLATLSTMSSIIEGPRPFDFLAWDSNFNLSHICTFKTSHSFLLFVELFISLSACKI